MNAPDALRHMADQFEMYASDQMAAVRKRWVTGNAATISRAKAAIWRGAAIDLRDAAKKLEAPVKETTTAHTLPAIAYVEKRISDYVSEYGVTDLETGTVEFPGNGEEYIAELEGILDGLKALAPVPVNTPDPQPSQLATCLAFREGDQMRCPGCRLAWDLNDADAPPCPMRFERA